MLIHIQNFQSIADLKIEASKFTIIRGKNHIGKSALYRAVKAAFRNRAGEVFIRDSKPSSRVNLEWLDHENKQHILTWSKNRKKSSDYIYNGTPHFSIDRKVPDFVSDFGMEEIVLGDLVIDPHFSSQGDGAFLMKSSESVITRFFSEILQLGSISKSLTDCSGDLKDTNSDIKILNKEINNLETELKNFSNLSDLDTEFNALAKLDEEIENSQLKLDLLLKELILNKLVQGISFTNDKVLATEAKELKELLDRSNSLNQYLSIHLFELPKVDYKKQFLFLRYITLAAHSTKLENVDLSLDYNTLLETSKQLHHLTDYIDKLKNTYKLPGVKKLRNNLAYLQYIHNHLSIETLKKEIKSLDKEIADVDKEMSSYKTCPTCGQEIN